jgi:uncharacterized BrkB/YihY/UPF0761 family membrane protein
MNGQPPTEDPSQISDARPDAESRRGGRIRRQLENAASRYPPLGTALGTHAVYREAGGALIASGLSYAALFALIPTLVLVVAGVVFLVDDPELRADALDFVRSAAPALEDVAGPAIDGAVRSAAVGSVLALVGFGWAASGLYLNLTRAMERFFPGDRVSGALARVAGVILVVLVIVGVLAAVVVAGALSVVARALGVDAEWLLALVSAVLTLALAAGITYGIYRVLPASPPSAASARMPALLVGTAIGLMTLFYGLISPWLVSGFEMFGVMASVFVALVWLRVVFIAMTYGAALARYRDATPSARHPSTAGLDPAATERPADERA